METAKIGSDILLNASWSEKGYGESMPVPQDDEDVEPPTDAAAARARQWCRAALALALIFASVPLAGKLFLGSWRFDGALDIACLCMLAAPYLYFVERDRRRQTPRFSRDTRQSSPTGGNGRNVPRSRAPG